MSNRARYTFAAIFTEETDGGYSVRFPQLDGCYTQGDNFDEAYRMAVNAMSLHLFGMEEDGEAIPEAVLMVDDLSEGEMLVPVTAWMTLFRDGPSRRR